jgi:protocatechuate 3,4-dioxygenase beta subunit
MTCFQRHATQAIVIALCAAVLCGCLSSEQRAAMRKRVVPTSEALVFNPVQIWCTSHCGARPITDAVHVDYSRTYPRFRVMEAMHRHVWVDRMSIHFDPNEYPIAVLTYRARNVLNKDYVLWMDDTAGPVLGGLEVFHTRDLVLDGQVHQLRQDLRQLNPAGNITQAWFAVHADETGDATIDLIDLRFEADPSARPTELLPDEPIAVRIVNSNGRPIAGACVTADSEFLNLARGARTDNDGRVTISPLQIPAGKHMLRVTAAGYVPIELHADPLPAEITLPRATTFGGSVVDEQGSPVANVAVHVSEWQRRDDRVWIHVPIKAMTGADGRWRSPPLPARFIELPLQFHHAQYMFDQNVRLTGEDLAAARQKDYQFTLERGKTVSGNVIDPDGKPVVGATVRIGRRTVHTDTNGAFTAVGIAPQTQSVEVLQPGYPPKYAPLTEAGTTVTIQLDLGRTLRGRVVDSEGNPLEGVMIKDTRRNLGLRVFTDRDGWFMWEGAPAQAEPLYVDAWHEDHGRARRQPISEDGQTVVVLEAE